MKYKGVVLLAFLALGNLSIASANSENKKNSKIETGVIHFVGEIVEGSCEENFNFKTLGVSCLRSGIKTNINYNLNNLNNLNDSNSIYSMNVEKVDTNKYRRIVSYH